MDETTCGRILSATARLHDISCARPVGDDDLAGRVTQEARTWASGASTDTLSQGDS